MEKVKSKGIVFRIVFEVFMASFLLSVVFSLQGSSVPSLEELFKAVFQPFEVYYDPLSDIVSSFNAIVAFVEDGQLPTLENLLDLFLVPFRFIGGIVTVFLKILNNIVELFT